MIKENKQYEESSTVDVLSKKTLPEINSSVVKILQMFYKIPLSSSFYPLYISSGS